MIKRKVTAGILCLIFTAFIPSLKAFDLKKTDNTLRKFVWAHNTPWHNPLDNDFTPYEYYNYPVLPGKFTNSTSAYKAEIALAQAQGIDGFLVDIIGKKGKPTNFVNQVAQLLKAAEGSSFKVGICLDRIIPDQHQINELERILKRLGNHPNYPKVGDKYVVATFSWFKRPPERWRKISEAMAKKGFKLYLIANTKTAKGVKRASFAADMVYAFGHLSLKGQSDVEVSEQMAKACKETNTAYMGTIWPGYAASWLRGRHDFYQPHIEFDQVLFLFDALFKTNPPWVHITTWNDHNETSFMPMRFEFGGNAVINKYLLNRWRGKKMPEKPQVLFSYHREQLTGCVGRFEAMLLPGKSRETVSVSGYLCSTKGKRLYKLPELSLKAAPGKHYAVAEWNIPTGQFAKNIAIVPEITVTENSGSRSAKLPAMVLRSGWIENPTTMKIPFDKIPSEAKSRLELSQKDNVLSAVVSLDSPLNITRATLFRNNRPIAMMSSKKSVRPLLNIMVIPDRSSFNLKVTNGQVLNATRQLTPVDTPFFSWKKNEIRLKKVSQVWSKVTAQISASPNAVFSLGTPKNKPVKFSLKELTDNMFIEANKKRIRLHLSPIAVNVNSFPPLKASDVKKLYAKVYSRKAFDNDIFYVIFDTADGKTFCSNIIAPFSSEKLIPTTVLQTSVTLETSTGASGRPGYSGYRTSDPPFKKSEALKTKINPATVQYGNWPLTRDNRNLAGERVISSAKKKNIPIPDKYFNKQEKALELNGSKSVYLPARVWPHGACTISFEFKPAGEVSERSPLLVRRGWSSAFSFYLLPGNKLEIQRGKSMFTTGLTPAKWNRIKLIYDGHTAKLLINDREAASKLIPLTVGFGNCTAYIGGGKKSGGAKGLFRNLRIASAPVYK